MESCPQLNQITGAVKWNTAQKSRIKGAVE